MLGSKKNGSVLVSAVGSTSTEAAADVPSSAAAADGPSVSVPAHNDVVVAEVIGAAFRSTLLSMKLLMSENLCDDLVGRACRDKCFLLRWDIMWCGERCLVAGQVIGVRGVDGLEKAKRWGRERTQWKYYGGTL